MKEPSEKDGWKEEPIRNKNYRKWVRFRKLKNGNQRRAVFFHKKTKMWEFTIPYYPYQDIECADWPMLEIFINSN